MYIYNVCIYILYIYIYVCVCACIIFVYYIFVRYIKSYRYRIYIHIYTCFWLQLQIDHWVRLQEQILETFLSQHKIRRSPGQYPFGQ